MNTQKIQTSWAIAAAAGEPQATIRVRNLQASIKVGRDAWGRAGNFQPILISAAISLRRPFEAASENDAVNASTVHYGTLSKAILAAVAAFNIATELTTLRQFLDYLAGHLTSCTLDGISNPNPAKLNDWTPVLDTSMARTLMLNIMLPKGSLIGAGVSIFGTRLFTSGDSCISWGRDDHYSMGLALHDLRIPTLIGVNPNERLAKQVVIADIELDQWTTERDLYNELEQIVVKTIEESSFETLEALASHVGIRITQYFIIDEYRKGAVEAETRIASQFQAEPRHYPLIKICLKKPTAVTLADAPEVAIFQDCHLSPQKNNNKTVVELWKPDKAYGTPPFPLQGTLSNWIQEQDYKNDLSAKTRSAARS